MSTYSSTAELPEAEIVNFLESLDIPEFIDAIHNSNDTIRRVIRRNPKLSLIKKEYRRIRREVVESLEINCNKMEGQYYFDPNVIELEKSCKEGDLLTFKLLLFFDVRVTPLVKQYILKNEEMMKYYTKITNR